MSEEKKDGYCAAVREEGKIFKPGMIVEDALKFKNKYPITIAWRIKKHAEVVEKHIDCDEKIKYVFIAQNTENPSQMFFTKVIVLTNKRLLLGQKRVIFGYSLVSVTPELYNDLKVHKGIIWGTVTIDTLHELVVLSHIAPEALDEIETNVNSIMLKQKRKLYGSDKK